MIITRNACLLPILFLRAHAWAEIVRTHDAHCNELFHLGRESQLPKGQDRKFKHYRHHLLSYSIQDRWNWSLLTVSAQNSPTVAEIKIFAKIQQEFHERRCFVLRGGDLQQCSDMESSLADSSAFSVEPPQSRNNLWRRWRHWEESWDDTLQYAEEVRFASKGLKRQNRANPQDGRVPLQNFNVELWYPTV